MRYDRYSIRTITAAGSIPLPFAVDDAMKRSLLKVDPTGDSALDTAQDTFITAQLRAAMGFVERHTAQVLTVRALEMAITGFPILPELISIPRAPVTAISSIKYTDPTTGAETLMDVADWRWSDTAPDIVMPAWRTAWPVAADEQASVRIRFTAGYEAGLAPPELLAAVRAMLVHLFENRSAVEAGPSAAAVELPLGVRDLCAGYRRILI